MYFEDLSKQPENDNVTFLKVDIDELGTIADFADVCAVPSFYFYSNGRFIDQYIGSVKRKLGIMVEKNLKGEDYLS